MKIIAFDVEGTIFKTKIRLPGTNIDSTIWQSLAFMLGEEAIKEEVDTHIKWEKGLYNNYIEWMIDTVSIHQKYGLKEDDFNNIINAAEYNDGVVDFFKTLDREKYIPILISGGFQNLAKRAQIDFKIAHSFAACEYYFDQKGLLKSYNLLPSDFLGKVHFVEIMLKEYRLSDNDWIFVGDGRNDIPIAQKSPLSVGFKPHRELRSVVNFEIRDFRELEEILLNL
jgi:phosphoserine phosphatase